VLPILVKVQPDSISYGDSQAVADGYLIPVPFGPFSRVTRRAWITFTDGAKSADQAIEALEHAWSLALARPADACGVRVLRHSGRVMWLVPNELGGLTMMLPDDD
jgi:hypothetical protein